MKKLLTGNEAIARGAWEAGVKFASAYPGTPSTEILENIGTYRDINAEWAPNEKVALEAVIGASIAGARSIAAMKLVGLNVAADPLFTSAYTGVNGGMVVISADDPSQFSSQTEQDNRNYAKAAKVAMFEPSNSQESKEMVKEAFEVSEKYDIPVLIRMTTRVCHSKDIVECEDRVEVGIKEYVKNPQKFLTVPAHAKRLRASLDVRLKNLYDYSNSTKYNYIEWNDTKTGVIASGDSFRFAKEVFGDTVSYLKLGFTHPLPDEKIKEFASKVDKLYVIDENDPYIEERVRLLGFDCFGKNTFPTFGEMTPDVIRKAVYGQTKETIEYDETKVVRRPPTLCAGCPHRGFFYELGKRKNVMVSGDIGCYTLAFDDPYSAMDTAVCMGGSFSIGHGAQKVFDMMENNKMRVVSVLGDSTFLHTGMNSLLEVAYNKGNTVNVILDNRITGMTGHQENPGTGYTLQGAETIEVDMEKVVRAFGINNVKTINPNNLKEVKDALDWALSLDETSVIITRWPCVLKKLTNQDKEEFTNVFKGKCIIDENKCVGCKACIKTGCPALSFDKAEKKAKIDPNSCVGCEVCLQVCPVKAIGKVEA
mgnify:CR=1 FL=1